MITEPFNTSGCWGYVNTTIPLYVPAGSKDKYQATAGWNEFTNIIEVASGYTLTIQTGAGGTLVYNGTSISGSASNFSVENGSSATISISPNTGYRLSKLIVNGSDVTSAVKNNSYTVSNITANTTISATFEAIPPTTYTLSITASGNGFASYSGTTVSGKTTTFTVNEGTSATITFTPDDGYRIASVKVDGTDVTSKVSGNKYTISGILTNTTVEVVFEAEQSGIDVTQYISATSLGGAITQTNNLINSGSQLNWNFSNKSSYNVTLKSLQLIDGQTGSEGNVMSVNQLVEAGSSVAYTTTIGALGIHTPVTCRFRYDYNGTEYFVDAEYTGTLGRYTLTIESMGNGSVTYDGTRIRNGSDSFRLEMLSSATLTFTPDAGYQLVSLKVGSKDVTSKVSGNKYTISSIVSNTTVIVEFGEALKELSHEGVNYTVASIPEKTVTVAKGSYEQVLTVPASFKEQNITWNVTGIDAGVLQDNKSLAAIIWNPKASFSESVSNPNLLLYVSDAEYAPASIKNVVVNGVAASITLTDAAEGNDFYCPREFTAEQISYAHRYEMTSGIEESRGWETISLPFDVGRVEHSTKGAMVPFASWRSGSTEKPFWLYQYGSSGFTEATAIRANTPYIICMPNNEHYLAEYRLNGMVTFSASNVKVKVSDEVTTATNGNRTFAPCFSLRQAQKNDYALNVNNEFTTNSSTSLEGSVFIRNSRAARPFEAYMTTSVQNAKPFISVFEELPTDIREIEFLDDDVQGSRFNDQSNAWYTLEGQKLSGKPTKRGVYIHNHKVVVR